MIRRLNFTGRKRIARTDVTVRLAPRHDGCLEALVTLALGSYGLPPAARVFVEAHRLTSWQRLDFGTVSAPGPQAPALLRGFGTGQGVRFRVRVVEAEPTGPAPRILALADDVRPAPAPGATGGLSLLPVDSADLPSQAFTLEVDDESGPLLLVSRKVVPDRDAFVGSREFVSLVLPEVLRRILERALPRASGAGDDEPSGWADDWIRLARSWPGVGPLPERGQGPGLSDDEEDWVGDAVEAFARSHAVPERFAAWWNAGAP